MPWLQLVRIECHDTEDTSVWGPVDMGEGDDEWLDRKVAPRSFGKYCSIELYDKDWGWVDKDDFLGIDWVHAEDADTGDKHLRFEGDGARYTLTARVTSEKPFFPGSTAV
jgi:hypothetical protein